MIQNFFQMKLEYPDYTFQYSHRYTSSFIGTMHWIITIIYHILIHKSYVVTETPWRTLWKNQSTLVVHAPS